jgi:hypothetical protein
VTEGFNLNQQNVLLQQELRSVNTKMLEMSRDFAELKASHQQILASVQQIPPMARQMGRMTTAVQRMAAAPYAIRGMNGLGAAAAAAAATVQQGGVGGAAAPPAVLIVPPPPQQQDNNDNGGDVGAAVVGGTARRNPASTLSNLPADLYVLWQEYQHGIGHRKAAKDFTRHERGARDVKHLYTRRKVVWDQISELVRAGDTALVAIDRIYAVYGRRTSVTDITKQLKADRKNGGPAALRL